ncbi:MAG: transposase [Flavobacterium sp.]|jgi:transposase
MENDSIIFIGMDTHKESSDVAYALDGRENVPVHFGKIQSKNLAVQKMVRHFRAKFPRATLYFCYEAGPCGYWMYRLISSMGHDCYVVAPSLIPKNQVTESKQINATA